MLLNTENVKLIEVGDWDKFIQGVYKKPYNFQQQDGCMDRGLVRFSVPVSDTEDDEMNEDIQEKEENKMGVKFKTWLAKKPKNIKELETNLFWLRRFYPSIMALVNDLYKKGLIKKGKYVINIDW